MGEIGYYTTQSNDTLLDIARAHDLGFIELMAANPGVDPWLPPPGTRVVLPMLHVLPDGPRTGIVINLATRRLFYFPPSGDTVQTFPIGVAVEGRSTPLGTTRVVRVATAPIWYPPPSIRAEKPELPRVVPAGPDNPLGAYALYLGWSGYLIHGTNHPYGIGRAVSHGCIQLYPEDIDRLYHQAHVGMPVRVIAQDTDIVSEGNRLYAIAYPSRIQADAIDVGEHAKPEFAIDLLSQLTELNVAGTVRINWNAVRQVGLDRDATLQPIGTVSLPATKMVSSR